MVNNGGMANIFGRTRPFDEARVVPTGETIGSYTSYLDAQKAVDYLADEKFPVQHVSIVGNDLKMVERVTGKLSYPRVAFSGALTGAWFGLFIGVLLSFFDGTSGTAGGPYVNVFTAILMGAAFWMLFAIIGYAAQRGKRDFTSTNQVLASNYDVIVTPDVAMDARRILAQLPMNSTAPRQHQAPYQGPRQGQGQGPYQGQGYQPPAAPTQTPPARPEGWHDPYGAPQQPAPQEAPAGQAPDDYTRPGQAPLSGPRRGQFPDLPDGRPQYGIRVDAPPAPPVAPAEPDDKPAEQ